LCSHFEIENYPRQFETGKQIAAQQKPDVVVTVGEVSELFLFSLIALSSLP
jgi:hypothetical protein